MSNFIHSNPHPDDATNFFYNAAPEITTNPRTTTSSPFVRLNNEWIWLILIVFVFLNFKDSLAGSEGKHFNILLLALLAFVLLSNTTCHK